MRPSTGEVGKDFHVANERLRRAMSAANVDLAGVAEAASVDVRTAERWLAGRLPHSRFRWAVANLVRQDEIYLWPETSTHGGGRSAGTLELVLLYAHRSDVPADVWWNLF